MRAAASVKALFGFSVNEWNGACAAATRNAERDYSGFAVFSQVTFPHLTLNDVCGRCMIMFLYVKRAKYVQAER